jgi:hypothetical protein
MIPIEQLLHLEGVINVPGRGLIYAGKLISSHATDKLLGLQVLVNDVPMRISGIEHFLINNPFHAGAKVGLRLSHVD